MERFSWSKNLTGKCTSSERFKKPEFWMRHMMLSALSGINEQGEKIRQSGSWTRDIGTGDNGNGDI